MSVSDRSGTDFLISDGEMGEHVRAFDWSQTPVGPIQDWPQSLATAVRLLLGSRYPMFVWWGRELTNIYNDAYSPMLGARHPQALGRSAAEVWADVWPVVGPQTELVLNEGDSTWNDSVLLMMERHGYPEEAYFTFSYSPAPDDDGGVGGVFAAVTEDTQRVFGERQLELLRDLAAETHEARTWREVCERSADALGTNGRDLPFALVYVAAPDSSQLMLAGTSGIEPSHPAAPAIVSTSDETPWPLGSVLGRRELVVVDDLRRLAEPLPTGAWDEPPLRAALVPLTAAGETARAGVLVVGLSPFRLFDHGYRTFLTLIGGQIGAAIAGADAYQAERRRAEALAELNRAKSVFFSNVSHELRTPLTLILGPLDDLLDNRDSAAQASRQSLQLARRNALRLLRMVNTVLDFSRAESAQSVGEFRPADLDRLTIEIAESFRPLLDRGGVELVVEVEPLAAPAYVDVEAWEKVVLNLLSNAFKFTLTGEVRVMLNSDGETLRLRVADTGTGIPGGELPRLFERFHRVRNEHARTQEGTGIGLALVRELVELHGGTVAADSTLDEGTTITVAIPLGSSHLPPDQVRHEADSDAGGGVALPYVEEASRWIGAGSDETPGLLSEPSSDGGAAAAPVAQIVVVDDNADMRDYLAGLLRRYWHVDVYPDGRAALEAILADPPALVVTDVMMPRLDGFGLLAALRADRRTRTLPVVVVSARAGEESSVEGLEAGADDYLVKPFSARELIARVRVNLELARLRSEAGRLAALEDVRSHVIATVSHELRTPVSAIYGAARTLRRRDSLDPDVREELLRVIDGESERLAKITNDILTTESLASGVISLAPEPVDMRIAAGKAVAAAKARLEDPHRLTLSTPDRPVRIAVDPSRLQQVLTNLLDNAVKYSQPDDGVHVLVETDDRSAQVVVSDRGIGIPEHEREQIFKRFYRVDSQLTSGVGGAGLGLYICREIVHAMGGLIRAEPNEPSGSRFVVSFPPQAA